MRSQSSTALRNVLESHKVSDMVDAKSKEAVIEIDSEMSAIEAADVLWGKNILGAPVWDEKAQKYLGFFDIRDILSAVIAASKIDSDDPFNAKMVDALGNRPEHTVAVSYLAARNPFISCAPDATLSELCHKLAARKTMTCHRIPIIDKSSSKKCQSIVTQSALVKYLSDKCSSEDLQQSLDEAGFPYKKNVISVPDTLEAHKAFDLLDSKRLSGLAVVDEETGVLVGNTSARDMKYAYLDEGRTDMNTDILSYLARVRMSTCKKARYPTCHVHDDSSVGHVINMIAKTGYHRIFVVDKDIKPLGVISVTDVLQFVIQQ